MQRADEAPAERVMVRSSSSSMFDKGTVDKNIYSWDQKSLRIRTINWWHVFLSAYLPLAYNIAMALMGALIMWKLYTRSVDVSIVWSLVQDPAAFQTVGLVILLVAYILQTKPSVYCIENVVFVPPPSWRSTHEDLVTMMKTQGCFTDESMDFLRRMLERSGTGDATHWPPSIQRSRDGVTTAVTDICTSRTEAETILFPLVRELFEKTGISPKNIDFLIVNCSLCQPTPSFCAMICHEFQLRKDVRTYNLGGMGCSANVISVDLAKQLLQNEPGTRALVLSTELLTPNLYLGNDKSMLLQNTLFRCGGAALLLSSRRTDSLRAKYKLLYTFRTQMCDDNSYQCVFEKEDSQGNHGIALSKDIVNVAGQAMKHNFVQLGPYVLP
jgi:3-ketoacyl-CoA synthase